MPHTRSATETKNQAKQLAEILRPRPAGATILALCGDLGAGKTTFIQGLAKAYGLPEKQITSPTFVIMKKYILKDGLFGQLIHIDCYRLNQASEIENLGWSELVADADNLIVVEWPDRIMSLLPDQAQMIRLSWIGPKDREIIYDEADRQFNQ